MADPANTPSLRRAADRGATRLDWLDSRHSFSFGEYFDPRHMGFRSLRVINDDIVAPGGGFGEHPHRDMEILTWVLDGSLRHRDSLGNGGVLGPGELQAMTAGSGIRHSEYNASADEPVHLLQIWIVPAKRGLPSSYAQRAFPAEGRSNRWQTVASGGGEPGMLKINADAALSVADLAAGAALDRAVPANRHGYLHVAFGKVTVNGKPLESGDAVMLDGPAALEVRAEALSQLLFFDLA
jgi:redox-sensitive bicupin YhaK (pirin superfamily)